MALPPREAAAEDAWLVTWRARDDHDALREAITETLDAGRPALAARLVGLLPEHDDDEPGIVRARRAAALLLVQRLQPEDVSWSELEDAWAEVRRDRMTRAKLRQRRRLDGDDRPVRRLDARRRR